MLIHNKINILFFNAGKMEGIQLILILRKKTYRKGTHLKEDDLTVILRQIQKFLF